MIQANVLSIRASTPMIHVPDVRATAAWYEAIGFMVDETFGIGAEWVELRYPVGWPDPRHA